MTVPRVTPTSSPIIPRKAGIELILFTGYPGTGKTTFYERNFKPSGYKHVNQDTLGNRTKCLKAVEEFLRKGTSCVVGELSTELTWFNALTRVCSDNTNRDIKTRKYYIDLARSLGVKVRWARVNATSAEL